MFEMGDWKWKYGDVGMCGVFVGVMVGVCFELGEYLGFIGWYVDGWRGWECGGDDR